jgi:translation initiation factor 1
MTPRSENPTVYSTETGRICPNCGRPVDACGCSKKKGAAQPAGSRSVGGNKIPNDGVVRVQIESKGRGGKTVSLVTGLALNDEALKKLSSDLKRMCGTGGTVKDRVIEIQGDHRDELVEELKKLGYKAKRVG